MNSFNPKALRKVEFCGHLPAYQHFNDCGTHPQFKHVKSSPDGYVFSESPEDLGKGGMRALKLLWRGLIFLPQFLTFFIKTWWITRSLRTTYWFVRTRHVLTQLVTPQANDLLFLPSVPFTFNQKPWVIEIEDTSSLLFPFVRNGQTKDVRVVGKPFFAAFQWLVRHPNCRAIISHVKSTAESLPVLLGDPTLAKKVHYIPMGVDAPKTLGPRQRDGKIRLLYTNSWHQHPDGFFGRGGLEVLAAFSELVQRHPQIELVLRTKLPKGLPADLLAVTRHLQIKIMDQFLPDDEWFRVREQSDIYVLPAARIHVVSLLEAMAFGMAIVTSDGWGIEEYVEHEKTGLIARGRYGKTSWIDWETGILREDYSGMKQVDPEVVKNVVSAIERLIANPSLRSELGKNARDSALNRFTIENWNNGLKRVFDGSLVPQAALNDSIGSTR